MRIRTGLFLRLFITGFACSGSQQAGTGGITRERNVIYEEEIRSYQASNVYELIRNVRPYWFQSRRRQSRYSSPTVVINGARQGGLEVLQTLSTQNILMITYLSPTDATTVLGINNANGAIIIEFHRE